MQKRKHETLDDSRRERSYGTVQPHGASISSKRTPGRTGGKKNMLSSEPRRGGDFSLRYKPMVPSHLVKKIALSKETKEI